MLLDSILQMQLFQINQSEDSSKITKMSDAASYISVQLQPHHSTCCQLRNKWLHHNNCIKRDGDMVNDVHYLHWFLLESDINVVITIMVAININIGNIMRLWSSAV